MINFIIVKVLKEDFGLVNFVNRKVIFEFLIEEEFFKEGDVVVLDVEFVLFN